MKDQNEINEEQQQLEQVDHAQAAEFEKELALLDREQDPDYDPEAEQAAKDQAKEQAKAAEEAEQAAAEMAAWGGIVGLEKALKAFVHPRFEFTDTEKQYAVENFAPFLIKYGASAPVWLGEFLAKYKEEIDALKGLAVLGKTSYSRIQQLRKEDAEEAAKAAQDQAENNSQQLKEAA